MNHPATDRKPRLFRGPLVALFVLVVLLLVPALATAGGRIVYRLGVEPPKEVLQGEGESKNAYAELTAERLRKRFVAAGIKEFELRTASPTTLFLETGWDHDRGWMEALIASPGMLELRRVTPGKPNWLGLARQIPEGIELRGDHPPYLWSARRSALQTFLQRITLPNGRLTVFPDEGGYRSVSLGEVVATQRQVKRASAQQSSTGAPFIAIDFETAVGASLAVAHVSEVEQIAIVLDGELIGYVPAKSFLDRATVRLSPPQGAVPDDRVQRNLWVRQVAGRLAAPLPIAIAVLKE